MWELDWGVHLRVVGSGVAAIKYLGTYVARTAIGDARMVAIQNGSVTFRWTDRADHDQTKPLTLPGVEFVARYLRHVLPRGLRSVRYYGFCHPAAKAKRLRLQLLTGATVDLGAPPAASPQEVWPCCPQCGRPLRRFASFGPGNATRGPPLLVGMKTSLPSVA